VSEWAIELRGVTRRYPRFALRDVDLAVPDGAVLGVVGPNGAGKSTLLRIVMGLVRPDAGEVWVLGRAMPGDERWIKSRVSFVSEDMALYPAATLRWHMDLVRDTGARWDEVRAAGLLERFALDAGRRVRELSRGQHVKAMMLLAMARRAELLVLDEATAGLDPLARHEVLALLRDTRRERRALVFSSHHGDDVSSLADHVAFVHDGRVAAYEPVDALLAGGGTLEQAFLSRVGATGHGRAA